MKTPWHWLLAALVALALFMSLYLLTKPAEAQEARCRALATVLSELRDGFHEYVVATGDVRGGKLFITATEDGNFTIIVSIGQQMGCIVAFGTGYAPDKGI